MMRLIRRFIDLAEARARPGSHRRTRSRELPCAAPLQRMGEEIGDAEIARFDELLARRSNRDAGRTWSSERAHARLTVEGAATGIEGPLLFLRRTLDVGLNDAVEVRGGDGRTRLGRVAAIDDEA